ncbi:hypothetical protein TRVL_09830 [Trypanosoma vivax]|nr:hypothetical protein TRVL_09830 [Trypanosoma vivax]
MAIYRQRRRRQRPWDTYRLHQAPARLARGRQLRHILLPPTQRCVSRHLPPPANQRIPLPFVLALLNHLVQLRQLRHPKGRCHGLALGNCPLCGHPDASCHCLVQRIRALGRPLIPLNICSSLSFLNSFHLALSHACDARARLEGAITSRLVPTNASNVIQ